MKLPKIPTKMYAPLGPLSVGTMTKRKAKRLACCGYFSYTDRKIRLAPGMHIVAQWVTLWHEAIHSVMTDAGAHGNTFSKEQEEVICDAVATYLTGMMLHGSLVVTSPGQGA